MSLVYIVFARFEWLSFDRQERYVRPIAEKMISITERLDNEIAVLLTAIRTKRRQQNEMSATVKVVIFLVSSVFFILSVASYLLFSVIQKAFFNLLIGWKGLKMGSLSIMFAKLTAVVLQLTTAMHIPTVLVLIILYPFVLLYQLAELFDVGSFYSLLTVTCEGAKSPIELFIYSFVLGVAILVTNSKYNFIWAVSLLEMNKSFVAKYWIEGGNTMSLHFILSVAAYLITSTNPFLTALRFFLSFIDFGAFFVVNNVTHEISQACVGIVGFQNQELWLVNTTSVLVWLLMAPMLYIISEIVCPKGGFTSTNADQASASVLPIPVDTSEDDENSSIYNTNSDYDSSVESSVGPMDYGSDFDFSVYENNDESNSSLNSSVFSYAESEYSQQLAAPESWDHVLSEVEKDGIFTSTESDHDQLVLQPFASDSACTAALGAMKYIWSHARLIVSTDLIFIYVMNVWVAHCQKLHSLENFLKLRANRRWDPVLIQQSMSRFRSEHASTGSWNQIMSYFSHYEKTARDTDILLEKKWDKVVHHPDSTKLPPYYRLCIMVQQEVLKKLIYLGMFWLFAMPISYIIGFSGVGHLLSVVGRKYWAIVLRKFYLFACVCVGFWTDESYAAYELEDLVSEFTVADPKEATIAFVSLTVASRAILLQALGGTTTLISIVIISMCGSPLFVFSPKMREKIPPFIYFSPRETALWREKQEILGTHHGHHMDVSIRVEEWVIRMRSLSILLTESRLIVFFAKLVSLSITMLILEGVELSTQTFALLLLCLLPYFIGSTLIPIIYIGKRLNLTDTDFDVVFTGCLKRTFLFIMRWSAYLLCSLCGRSENSAIGSTFIRYFSRKQSLAKIFPQSSHQDSSSMCAGRENRWTNLLIDNTKNDINMDKDVVHSMSSERRSHVHSSELDNSELKDSKLKEGEGKVAHKIENSNLRISDADDSIGSVYISDEDYEEEEEVQGISRNEDHSGRNTDICDRVNLTIVDSDSSIGSVLISTEEEGEDDDDEDEEEIGEKGISRYAGDAEHRTDSHVKYVDGAEINADISERVVITVADSDSSNSSVFISTEDGEEGDVELGSKF